MSHVSDLEPRGSVAPNGWGVRRARGVSGTLKGVIKRVVLVVIAAAVVAAVYPVVRPVVARTWFVFELSTDPAPAQLDAPIATAHRSRMADSWGAPRAGGRKHEGVDIFTPKGTPVLSTTRGLVTRVGVNRLGGQVVGVLGPGLEWHYYAHLDRSGSFREGDIVMPGDVLGYVGNTGNARGTPPHLHYGIYRNGAQNPYPRLVPAEPGRVDAAD